MNLASSVKFIVALFFFSSIGIFLFFSYSIYEQLTRPIITSAFITIELKPHSSANTLVQSMYDQGLIGSKELFLKYIQYKHVANKIKAGVYQVIPGESAIQLIARIVAGDVLKLPFRIVEGTNLNQIKTNLEKTPFLTYKDTDWLNIQSEYSNAEGLLLAETYQYDAGSDAKKLLNVANRALWETLEKNWQNRAADLPYKTAYEMLIVASILEKETASIEERKIIAGIIVNRLRRHMPLQMDPTIIYALGDDYEGKLHHDDLAIVSPYNTYRNKGLPPTPIAMVGKISIEASAHPIFNKYLYFVAKGDGTHVFSTTYNEQRAAIKHYLNRSNSCPNKEKCE